MKKVTLTLFLEAGSDSDVEECLEPVTQQLDGERMRRIYGLVGDYSYTIEDATRQEEDALRANFCDRCFDNECDADCDDPECKCNRCPDDGGECQYCENFYKGSIALAEHEDDCPERTDDTWEGDDEDEEGDTDE